MKKAGLMIAKVAWVTMLFAAIHGMVGANESAVDYAREVQPILASRCYACHGPDEAEGGIRFDRRVDAIVEADSGERAIVAEHADQSEMLVRIMSEDPDVMMPPEGDRLSDDEVETLRRWINQGADYADHWAFTPMKPVAVPEVVPSSDDGEINPIDAFVIDRLRSRGLEMSPAADRRTLIRRVTYDLTGLPPTATQVADFVANDDPDAYPALIERLLASPQYGERWGRHWLDLVRYAETNSFERDGPKPNAWKYRDYVIRSFNDDKAYDQFITEQLAGDEIDNVTTESLTATGYYRLGIWDDEPSDLLQARYDELDDIIATTSQALLGLTLNCARCHDHKIDPIKQTDYYSMVAIFNDVTSWGTRGDQTSNNQLDISSKALREDYAKAKARIDKIKVELQQIEQTGIAKMSATNQRATEGKPAQRQRVLEKHLSKHLSAKTKIRYSDLKEQLHHAEKKRRQLPNRQTIMGLARITPQPDQTFVLYRGNPGSPTDPVPPAVPELLRRADDPTFDEKLVEHDSPWLSRSSLNRRLALAKWITSPSNPLTTRVIVNRIWQHHFGRGIVASSNNFGFMATPPTHPELLDWLANTFITDGYRFKAMHRRILLSRTYQQSSRFDRPGHAVDPQNQWLWRFNPRRLDSEEIRDSLLDFAGVLNPQSYGPSVFPALSAEVLQSQSRPGEGWDVSSPEQQNRRSVYVHVKRSLLLPMMSEFDFPDPDQSCEARFKTLGPGQALALINGDFTRERAAEITSPFASLEQDQFIDAVFERLFQKAPSAFDIEQADALLADLTTDFELTRSHARQRYVLTLLNRNELLFLD